MYSKSQIETLALLDKYFSETPESTIKADIQAISELDFVGSSAKDYFSLFHKYLNYEPFKREPKKSQVIIALSKYPNVNGIPKMNKLSNILSVKDESLYLNRIKSVVHSSIVYNHINTRRVLLSYSERNNNSILI